MTTKSAKRARMLVKKGHCTRCGGVSRTKFNGKTMWYCRECAIKRSGKYYAKKDKDGSLTTSKKLFDQ